MSTSRQPGMGTYYASYLHVDDLLRLQQPVSSAHEEMLFIVVHQAYELWFKQILYELNSVRRIFSGPTVAERDMGIAVARLQRVKEIQALCLSHISVLETMSPLDFLAFRDVLYPASGFQSVQFRCIENALGLRSTSRLSYGGARGYCSVLRPADEARVLASEAEPSLFDLLERWLERTPFLELEIGGTAGGGATSESGNALPTPSPSFFSFWDHYRAAVDSMLTEEEAAVRGQSGFTEAAVTAHLADIASQRAHFENLLDADKYEASRARGERRLSHRATQAALMITLFQHEPGLQLPYRMICGALEIDELLGAWRARHAQMVHRMLGAKIGTGGSSGYSYLKATVDRHRIFNDFFDLATFLLPPQKMPPLPRSLQMRLSFNFEGKAAPGEARPSAADGGADVTLAQPGAAAPASTQESRLAALKDVLRARREGLGAAHADTIESMRALAFALADAGRHAEATPYFREALNALMPAPPPAPAAVPPRAAAGGACPFGHG